MCVCVCVRVCVCVWERVCVCEHAHTHTHTHTHTPTGGRVNLDAPASEGLHNVALLIQQNVQYEIKYIGHGHDAADGFNWMEKLLNIV